MKPYYTDPLVTIYHGDCREIVPLLPQENHQVIVTDPPYGETSLKWDKWPTGWLEIAASISNSMWCFGSLRMFTSLAQEALAL